jgi:hypothetical protein
MSNIKLGEDPHKYIAGYMENTQHSYGVYWVFNDFATKEEALKWMNNLEDWKKKSARLYEQIKTKEKVKTEIVIV